MPLNVSPRGFKREPLHLAYENFRFLYSPLSEGAENFSARKKL